MLSPEELADIPERVRKLWLEFEEDALCDIAARIAANGEMVATAKWRADKLKELGEQSKYLQKQIAKRLKVSNDLVAEIIKDAVYESLENDEELLKEAHEKGLIKDYKANPKTINPLLSKGVKLIDNTIKKTALSYASKYSKTLSLALDKAHLNVEAGVMSIDEAVKQSVHDLADKGIGAYITSPSGRNERVSKVIERAVRTGVSKSILDAQYENLLELGCDLVEVSSHIGARPSHALWQGEIYSISGKDKRYKPFKETTGYGQIDGLGGINCRHSFYPYFDGISTKSHRTFKLDENEDVYNLRQQYKNALNNAEKYRLRASIEKAGGLNNSKSLQKFKVWKFESDFLYNLMPVVTHKAMTTGAYWECDSIEALDHSINFYGQVRKRTTDCRKIAEHTGYPEHLIRQIKDHVFYNEHELEEGKRRFYPDIFMAHSWDRLTSGINIQSHDLLLLEHEMYELIIEKDTKSLREAHEAAEKLYNYSEGAQKWYDSLGKYRKGRRKKSLWKNPI